jgi:hypothetical protein
MDADRVPLFCDNAQRRGFDLLYTRAILVKSPSDPTR